jgi:predicted ATP-grasp superfamily ATP-dependent carboligase
MTERPSSRDRAATAPPHASRHHHHPGTLVVAGLCARPLAESARQAGWQVIAMDLFGDADTRRASLHWCRIGDPVACAIDPVLLRDALRRSAREPDTMGWVAGSGFEPIPEALDEDVPGLPLLGMPAAAVRRVRDPMSFFPMLDRLGFDHPEVSLEAPDTPEGWLVKRPGGSGGWHIRRAGEDCPLDVLAHGAEVYYQRVQAGEPMSALFVADGTRARLVALNRLIVRPLGPCPYVYAGAIGPIRDRALEPHIEQALAALVPAFGLRGLASLDFIADDGRAWLLEINPRPSGSMLLHSHAWPGGLLLAHVRAMQGRLPDAPAAHLPGVHGSQTVFAGGACRVGLSLAAELARSPDCHDLPVPGSRFSRGEPVCSVSAEGAGTEAVLSALDARADQVRRRLTVCEEATA